MNPPLPKVTRLPSTCHQKQLSESRLDYSMMGKERRFGNSTVEMGNASSQIETGENTQIRKKKRKHTVEDELDRENAQDDPSRPGDSSTRHKTKRRRTDKRRKKARKLDSEHSKEEESARTLLEMKGAASLSNSFDQEEELALSPQVSADLQNDDGSAPANEVHVNDRERQRKKHSGHKSGKRRRPNEGHADELGTAVPTGNMSMDDVVAPVDELPSTVYRAPTEQHPQSFHPMADIQRPLDRFTLAQKTVQDATIAHSYNDVPAYADPSYRVGTPPYGPAATPSPLHSTESQRGSPNGTSTNGNKRKGSQQQDLDPQNGNTFTTYGRGGKRGRVLDSTEAHISAALAHAATAANALIDPVLTGQPPLWTIVDGKTAYMGKIVNPSPSKNTARKDKVSQKSGSKKKRRLPVDDLGESESASVVQKPKKRAKRSVAPEIPTAADGVTVGGQVVMTKGGPFSEHEENMLKQFMDCYRLEHGLTEYELNARVWAERRLNRDDFWDQVSAVLPYRPRQSIYKYCRRQFHNFPKRGQWTLEEDEELVIAAKEHPQQWKTVGSLLNRMPEDCRDRWRNYLKCGEARKKDVWTEQEENLLKQHVREVIVALSKEKGNASASGENVLSDEDVERKAALINWTVISEKMGGTRSRIQCSYKWKKLQKMAAREQEQAKTNEGEADAEPQPKKTWRAKRAEGNFFKMLPGDKYDLLKALKDSGTYEEKNIPWKLVGSPEFCKTWNLTDRKTAFKFLKQTVPNHENMTLQDIVSELLKELNQLPPDILAAHYVAPQISPKQSKRSKNLSTEVVTEETGEEDVGYHRDSSQGGFDHQEGGGVVDQGLDSQSGNYPHRLSMEEDRYLGAEVDERMVQQVQLLRHV